MLEVRLDAQDTIVAEAGAMVYMSPNIDVKTRKREAGSLFQSLKTAFLGGESFFVNEYTALDKPAKIGLVAAPVGDIRKLEVKSGRGYIVQRGGYLASTRDVHLDTEWQGFTKGLFGQTLFMLKATGQGDVFVNSFGAMDSHTLGVNESLIVDNYHLVAFDDTCRYEVKKFGGLKSTILGGEGLVTEISGPGEVYVQTKNEKEFVDWLWNHMEGRVRNAAAQAASSSRGFRYRRLASEK
jgi:uncharacterized protein (TIGR00266 family)